MASACASSGVVAAVPRPFPTPGGEVTAPPAVTRAPAASAPSPAGAAPETPAGPAASSTADRTVVDTALRLRGVPYRNGGTDPSGFDCSGFTQYVFARHGVMLPREVRDQFHEGSRIKLSRVQPGDLVFFHTVARGPSHVGIVIGDDEFIHAPSSAGVVRIERLSSTYWSRRFIAARRISSLQLAARRRPSGEESTVAAATTGPSGARGSKAAD
jgi:cell wall-associated NlpC family hydrolase